MADKLFLITRADLPPGAQAVQAAHAFRELIALYPNEEAAWYRVSNHIALLAARNERELANLLRAARDRGIPHASFREPDFGGQLTAIALAPGPHARSICRKLPLALALVAQRPE